MILAAACGGGGSAPSPSASPTYSPAAGGNWPPPTAKMLALRKQFPPPGRMVPVDGLRRLHLVSTGTGTPTVVMEAGSGDWGLTWCLVAPQVARTTEVVTYDRAGLGWSDPTGLEPTAGGVVRDLHEALIAADILPPYVLVGHSMGAVYMRLFAHVYPREVVGMVLVDPGDEHIPQAVGAKSATAIVASTAATATRLEQTAANAAVGNVAAGPVPIPSDPHWPASVAAQYDALYTADPWIWQTTALESLAAGRIWAEVRAAHITSVGDIPLVVIRSSTPMGLSGVPSLAAAENAAWRRLQAQQAKQSSQGHLIVAPHSGHMVQLDDPGLVVKAIDGVVAAARAQNVTPTPGGTGYPTPSGTATP